MSAHTTSHKNTPSFACILVLFLLTNLSGKAQITLHTDDLPRFFEAFDSVMTTTDTASRPPLSRSYTLIRPVRA